MMTQPRGWTRFAGRLARTLMMLSFAIMPLVAQSVPDRLLVTGTLAFDGDATLGDFTGTTTTVAGHLNGADQLAGVRGWVTAPARTLETGNGHRDSDMYESLEVDRYAVLRFDLDSVLVGREDGDSIAVTLRGRFTIHGVTRRTAIPGWVWLRSGTTRFKGEVSLNLKDYAIEGLSKFLGMLKMDENILVRVDLTFKP